ncbi:MAG: carboxy terminal-processing peptidase [Bacteroidetes bacterium]|nr:carboxy terminal-processing peptidase [Bacteroidota bacterium]
MKRISVLVVLVLIGSVVTTQLLGKSKTNLPPDKYEKIMFLVGKMLTDGHYSPQQIDDAFSKRVFYRYITELDPEKNIFLKKDIAALQVYEAKIDDELTGAPILFFKAAGNLFTTRVQEAELLYQKILSNSFAFTANEEVVLDAAKLDFSLTESEREQRWRNKLKYMALERYAEGLDLNQKASEKDTKNNKSAEELEKEARDKVGKIMARTFDRFRNKFNEDDKFNLFVNTITTTMDPHTEFMPPVDKRYFDEEMSGQFFGIGATLQYDEGNIKITSVVAGSPAYKSGQIQAGDIILKVGQAEEEPVDLTGFMTTDAVKLIRGKKDSEVRLTLRKIDGTIKVVSLIRDRIVQDEGYARSAVFLEDGKKIGYLYLPDFYADFENPNGPRCFTDVANELVKLKAEGISGLIFDLRNNGGGSLYDVVQMAGLFIAEGPIVQVKDRDRPATILRDKDRAIQYEGPLVVLVNEFSASASEIFAAAIQDYGRGIVMGSSSTYGKGTVQRNIGLDPQYGFSSTNAELGTVKLTLQKFYRVNGGSTQLKGVTPDVIIPDNMEYLKFREKDTKESLPWDQIAKTPYITWTPSYLKDTVVSLASQRISHDTLFQLINSTASLLSKQNESIVNLQLDTYKKAQEQVRAAVKRLDLLQQGRTSLQVNALQGEENRWSNDKPKQERFERWLKSLGKDIYVEQGIKTMKDMIKEMPATAKRA